jgi:zinc protease
MSNAAVQPELELAPSPATTRARLANGLEVVLIPNRQAPIVTTVLVYRAGARDEAPGASGAAHFLEHMMFKGAAIYGPGEIDRRTQALGGINNAFTSHDATAYYFAFASDRWREALAIERDRLVSLALDPAEFESERQVILEELAMYRDEPWDALELDVQAELYRGHRYGMPVLGEEEELEAMRPDDLADYRRRYYRPGNALLAVAGDFGPAESALAAVEEAFGDLPAGSGERPPLATPRPAGEARRVERRVAGGDAGSEDADERGDVARLLLMLALPPAEHDDFPAIRLLATVLGGGRSSRLQKALVDVGQLCLSADCGVAELEASSSFSCALEVLPGVDPSTAEARLHDELARLRAEPVSEVELHRARRILAADWVFQHERIHQQAIVAALAAAHGDLDLPRRVVDRALRLGADELREVAQRHLDPRAGSVLGLSRAAG